jgi:chromosome segregation ATPase
MSTTMPNTTMSTTIDHDAAEGLREVEARRETARTRLAEAQREQAELTAEIAAARDAYRAALAGAALEGGAPPSRAEFAALEGLVPLVEDRVAGLERALVDIEREWRLAKAAALEAEAAEVRRETARHQARINELSAEVRVLETELGTHGDWIRNKGPLLEQRLLTEAHRLRRQR